MTNELNERLITAYQQRRKSDLFRAKEYVSSEMPKIERNLMKAAEHGETSAALWVPDSLHARDVREALTKLLTGGYNVVYVGKGEKGRHEFCIDFSILVMGIPFEC